MSISISIYIYTAIPWKETWKKIKYSQEIALIGELQGRAQKKGSVTTLALDNHTWAGSLHKAELCIKREAPCLRASHGRVPLAFGR